MQHSRIPVPFSAQKIPLTNLVSAIVIAEFSAVIQLHVYLCENMSQPVFSQKAQGQTGGGVVAPFLVRPTAFFDLAAQKSRYLAEQLVDQGIRHVYGCFRGDDRRRTCNFKFGEIRVLPYLLYAQIIVHQDFPLWFQKAPSYDGAFLIQQSTLPTGMLLSSMTRCSSSLPFTMRTAESSIPQDSSPIILRGGRLTIAATVLPTSSSGL